MAAEAWVEHEGWDPGHRDTDASFRADPGGFFLGRLDGRPVSAISLIAVNDGFAFLGNYLVDPEFRGRGYGLATWNAAFQHAGERTIGLEAVPSQVASYQAAGFTSAYCTAHYQGRIRLTTPGIDPSVTAYDSRYAAQVAALDETCQAGPRTRFLTAWLRAPEHCTLVQLRGGEVAGFGTIRRARTGLRLGPLIAENENDALTLYDALTEPYPGEHVDLYAPQPNLGALLLARARGLAPAGHTVRMYNRPVRPVAVSRYFAQATLAYG